MVDPVQLLVKTAANYIVFKVVKGTVDTTWNGKTHHYQYAKAGECQYCLGVWSNNPQECPRCGCTVIKKLFRDYDFKKHDENGLEIDSSLMLGGGNGTVR